MVSNDGKDVKEMEGSKYGWRVRGEGEKGVVKTRVSVPGGGPDIIVEDRGWDDYMMVKVPKHLPRDYGYMRCKWPRGDVDELIERYIKTGPWHIEDKEGMPEVLEFIE